MDTPRRPIMKAGDVRFGRVIMSDFETQRRAEGRLWAEGYTRSELDGAQEEFGLTFPPDLIALFLERRPVRGWDWRFDRRQIREMMEWPFKGLLFDVENANSWWPEWGDKPSTADGRAEVLRSVVSQAPKLVPLVSHRYIPGEPNEAGNPVFSIYQSDVICYGADIGDYFEREFGNKRSAVGPTKRIRFWSDLVERY